MFFTTLCVVLSLAFGLIGSRLAFRTVIDFTAWMNKALARSEQQSTAKFGVGQYEAELSVGCAVLGTIIALVCSLHSGLSAQAYFVALLWATLGGVLPALGLVCLFLLLEILLLIGSFINRHIVFRWTLPDDLIYDWAKEHFLNAIAYLRSEARNVFGFSNSRSE